MIPNTDHLIICLPHAFHTARAEMYRNITYKTKPQFLDDAKRREQQVILVKINTVCSMKKVNHAPLEFQES